MNLFLVKLSQYQETGYRNGEQRMDLRDVGDETKIYEYYNTDSSQ